MAINGNCSEVTGMPTQSIDARIEPMHASMQDLKNGKWCHSEAHGQPGVISNVKMSKTGKHGHAKFTFNLAFPFTGQTSQEMFPGHTHLKRPIVRKYEMMVTDVEDNDVTCYDEENGDNVTLTMRRDFVDKNGEDLGEQFHAFYEEVSDAGEEDVWISILEAPIHDKKGNKMVRMIEKWCAKGDAEN